MTIDDIRYAKNGEYHLAYEVLGDGRRRRRRC